MLAVGLKRMELRKKAVAVRTSLRPRTQSGCYLVKVIEGPSWAVGEYGTYDAETEQLFIDGEPHDADAFQFILA